MAGKSASPCIVWFRDDLRLSDHPALHAASKPGAPVICLYVFDEASDGAARAGRRVRLAARRAGGWRSRCGPCKAALPCSARHWCCARGPAAGIIAALARADRRRRGVLERDRSKRRIGRWPIRSHRRCRDRCRLATFPGDLLAAPATIRSKDGRGLRVFTPFWRRVRLGQSARNRCPRRRRCVRGRTLPAIPSKAGASSPRNPDWAGGLRESWTPGEPSGATTARGISCSRRGRLCQRARPPRPRRAPRGCPRIYASARSARGRSGTPPALPRPNAPPCPAMSTSS